jgi:hypothetical protein
LLRIANQPLTREVQTMRKKLTKMLAGFAALAAFALGGATLASADQIGSSPSKPAAAVTGVQKSTAKADAETNDTPGAAKSETKDAANAADTDAIQSQNGKDDPTEQAGVENGSEVANNDGPGGHADEPGNPQADHQFEGQE